MMLNEERETALHHVEEALETPMNVLALVWLALTVVEFTMGLSDFLQGITTLVWVIFWVDFILKLVLAPEKIKYIRNNWLTLFALILPALRIFRFLRAFRFFRMARGGQVVKAISTFNRGMGALRRSLRHRGFGYVAALTLIVNVIGAAAIYALEHGPGSYIDNFGTALWWTSMMLTSMGSDFFPVSSEGRFLALLLAIFGFAVFGYVTATVASFFVDRDAASEESQVASQSSLELLHLKLDRIEQRLNEIESKNSTPPL